MVTKMVMTDWYADVRRTIPWWLRVAKVVSLRINDPARYEELYGSL